MTIPLPPHITLSEVNLMLGYYESRAYYDGDRNAIIIK